jgi:uncharacterized protein YdaU (DUF1376 family)
VAEFPCFPLWTDSYLGDTSHLTTLEHGAYLLLLIAMWRTKGQRLPKDDKLLARYAGLSLQQWGRVADTILPFFKELDGHLLNGRLSDEWHSVKQRHDAAVAGGKASALKRLNRGSTTLPIRTNDLSTLPSPSPSPSPSLLSTTELYPESSLSEKDGKKLNGHNGINGNGKWSDPANRNNFAIQACIPFLPGRDDGERWAIAVAAEDQKSPKYTEACRAMRLAAGKAKVGWVSPHRRKE